MRRLRSTALLIALVVFGLGVVPVIGAGPASADCVGYKNDQARIDSALRGHSVVAKGRVVGQTKVERDATGSMSLIVVDIEVTEAYRGAHVGEILTLVTTPDVSTWREFTTGSDYVIVPKQARSDQFPRIDLTRWSHLYDDDCSPTAPADEVGPEFFAALRAKTGATAAPNSETAASEAGQSSNSTFVWLGVAGGAALVIVAAGLVWRARRAGEQ